MSDTLRTLDAAVHAHAEDAIEPGEVILTWMVLVGTRTAEDGGTTAIFVSEGGMPRWQAKGLLVDALDLAKQPPEDPT